MLLMPLQRGLGAVDANVQVVFLTDADLRRVNDALRPALEADQNVAVIVELAAFNERRQVRAERVDAQAMLDTGVDGVDLRITAHGCMTDEPEVYGWNPPVMAAYRERFGDGPIELSKLATVRGDFYTQFVREVSKMVRERGKKLQLHLHAEAFRPDPVFGQQNGVPANIEFQWRRWLDEGLADSVYLRTSWFEGAEDPLGVKSTQRSRLKRMLADPVAHEMLAVAAKHRLPVILNRYIGRAAGLDEYLDDLELTARDGRFAGFDVYEFFDLAQSDPVHSGLTPRLGRLAGLKERWQKISAAE